MSSTSAIRLAFIDYFSKFGHEPVNSSPLVLSGDPSLLFVNSGMVQFKKRFTDSNSSAGARVVSCQKCMRAGGKHNDLDNVGYTPRHHTFFEMLGNFSFGDYFKEEAIWYAWDLLTNVFSLSPSRLVVTVYHDDMEAYQLWRKVAGLPESRIIKISTSDNFWQMGDTGPCGPCSEIFYDHGEGISGDLPGSFNETGDRFVEIWNLVFMQFEQLQDGSFTKLPSCSVDTGMGLERMAAVLQKVHDNYEIDLFRNLLQASAKITRVAASERYKVSHRVIVDHIRAIAFMIADGVLPSNEGRGYVLRRIMRRAMRHSHILSGEETVLQKMFPYLLVEMGEAYPELYAAKEVVLDVIQNEENRFNQLLVRGLKLLETELNELACGEPLSGEIAFKLYDTYGFPLDLMQEIARERGIEVDEATFHVAMGNQQERSRAAQNFIAQSSLLGSSKLQSDFATEFLGYEADIASSSVISLMNQTCEVHCLSAGMAGSVITAQTPFYAEGGGQVGDMGFIYNDSVRFRVSDTRRLSDTTFIHDGVVEIGEIKTCMDVTLEVDSGVRQKIKENHSATHLLHEALREVLGGHISQKGSLVTADQLRFDFSHSAPLTDEELQKVEDVINEIVLQGSEVVTNLMATEDAIRMGAKAFFDEKYGNMVRVVSIGVKVSSRNNIGVIHKLPGEPFSVELCGGTHVGRISEVRFVKIITESAVASGVRRIEALAGDGALRYFREQMTNNRKVASVLGVSSDGLVPRVQSLLEENSQLKCDLRDLRNKLVFSYLSVGDVLDVDGTKYLGKVIEGISPKEAKILIDKARELVGSGVAAIVAVPKGGGKATLVVGITRDLFSQFDALELVRCVNKRLGGAGGGNRCLAQASISEVQRAKEALTHLYDAVKQLGARVNTQ